MSNILSTAVIAFALALLVPSNGAQAVRLGADGVQAVSATFPMDASGERPTTQGVLAPLGAPEPGMAWIMALGFLGAVILRRMRG